jgi:hypothetical protein
MYKNINKVLILSYPRSGSNLLCYLLDKSGYPINTNFATKFSNEKVTYYTVHNDLDNGIKKSHWTIDYDSGDIVLFMKRNRYHCINSHIKRGFELTEDLNLVEEIEKAQIFYNGLLYFIYNKVPKDDKIIIEYDQLIINTIPTFNLVVEFLKRKTGIEAKTDDLYRNIDSCLNESRRMYQCQ